MNTLPMLVTNVETVYAEIVMPNMTFNDVLDRIGDIGEQAGKGKASPINVGLELAQYNEFFAGDDQNEKVRRAYERYAERANAANPYETVIDLSPENAKSIDAQASKLNLFVNIGGQIGGDECVKLIKDTIALVKQLPGKKPSVYETILKALRANKVSKKPLDATLLNELVDEMHAKANKGGTGFGGGTKKEAEPVTEEASLNALLNGLRVHHTVYGGMEVAIKSLEDRLMAVTSTLVKKAA